MHSFISYASEYQTDFTDLAYCNFFSVCAVLLAIYVLALFSSKEFPLDQALFAGFWRPEIYQFHYPFLCTASRPPLLYAEVSPSKLFVHIPVLGDQVVNMVSLVWLLPLWFWSHLSSFTNLSLYAASSWTEWGLIFGLNVRSLLACCEYVIFIVQIFGVLPLLFSLFSFEVAYLRVCDAIFADSSKLLD